MPLREYNCKDCLTITETLVRNLEDELSTCPHCNSTNVELIISNYGGYKGNLGSSSTRPKLAGAFTGRRSKIKK